MTHLKKTIFLLSFFLCLTVRGQVIFEKTIDDYVNSWTNLVFVQQDGYLIPFYGAIDKYNLCLLKTDRNGNTLWKKEYDYGNLKYVGLSGTQDSSGNIYLQSGDYQNKLIKYDKDGNELWVKPSACNTENLICNNDILWMVGEVNNKNYLYKIDANSGDSLDRYMITQNTYSGTTYECTSLVVTPDNNVLITVTKRYPNASEMNTEFYRLSPNASEIEPYNINLPTYKFLVLQSMLHNDEIIYLGEWIEQYKSTPYLIRLNVNGSITSFNEYNSGDFYTRLFNFTVNKENQVVTLGEVNSTVSSILLIAFSPEGDTLWTKNIKNSIASCIDIKATPDNGYILTGNKKAGNQYMPYIVKIGLKTLPTDTLRTNEPLEINPVRGKATFNTKGISNGEIIILSQSGTIIKKLAITNEETSWDCFDMEPGMYYYSIVSSKKKVSGKLIISP